MTILFCLCLLCFGFTTTEQVGPAFTSRISGSTQDLCKPKPKTYYTIASTDGRKLTADDTNLTSVSLAKDEATDNQKWYFEEHKLIDTLSFFSIQNKQSNLTLGVSSGNTKEGALFDLSPFENKAEQKFLIRSIKDGCKLTVSHTEMHLTASLNNETEKAPLFQKFTSRNLNQQWTFEEQICDPYPHQFYQIVHVESKKAISVAKPKQGQNNKLILTCQDESNESSLFQFLPTEKNQSLYAIKVKKSQKLLGFDQIIKGSPILELTQKDKGNKHFSLRPGSSKEACLIQGANSQLFLGPNRNLHKTGTGIVLGDDAETKNNLWLFDPVIIETTTEVTTSEKNTTTEIIVPYRLKNKGTRKFMEVKDASTKNKARVVTNIYAKGSQHQIFYFDPTPQANGWFNIRAKHSGKVLDANRKLDPVLQYDQRDVAWHRFKMVEVEKNGTKCVKIVPQNKQDQALYAIGDEVQSKVFQENDQNAYWEVLKEV